MGGKDEFSKKNVEIFLSKIFLIKHNKTKSI